MQKQNSDQSSVVNLAEEVGNPTIFEIITMVSFTAFLIISYIYR